MVWLGQRWELRDGDELVGTITVEDQDFPWLLGSFAAEDGFARWAPLFTAERELADELADRDDADLMDRWERLHDRIAESLTLVAPHEPVAHFLLHIEDDKAWFAGQTVELTMVRCPEGHPQAVEGRGRPTRNAAL